MWIHPVAFFFSIVERRVDNIRNVNNKINKNLLYKHSSSFRTSISALSTGCPQLQLSRLVHILVILFLLIFSYSSDKKKIQALYFSYSSLMLTCVQQWHLAKMWRSG